MQKEYHKNNNFYIRCFTNAIIFEMLQCLNYAFAFSVSLPFSDVSIRRTRLFERQGLIYTKHLHGVLRYKKVPPWSARHLHSIGWWFFAALHIRRYAARDYSLQILEKRRTSSEFIRPYDHWNFILLYSVHVAANCLDMYTPALNKNVTPFRHEYHRHKYRRG